MKVNLYTDAPKHNLALMKLSAYHKEQGNEVTFNMPIMPCDLSYASILYDWNKDKFHADMHGGIGFSSYITLDEYQEKMKPDYDLFPIDYSLGYTFRPCYRQCAFCKVPHEIHYDSRHHSIYEFHNPKFNKICLLNNNTFFDEQWRETFEEIWDADLTVVDENGYDLRLLDDEKCEALKKTKFDGQIHFAYDLMQYQALAERGLSLLQKYKIRGHVYVLVGFNTTEDEDIYRCQKIVDCGHDPYVMPYNQNKQEKRFKRFIDTFMWRKYPTIEQAWKEYKR